MSTIDERWNIVDTTRAFCQKVLPLVYDESLSYMELVCKLSSKLNEVIENNNNLPQYVKDLIKEIVNSDEFTRIVGSVLMDTIINVKVPPEGITPAKGDGVTDDTSSIQACLDYANRQGGAVVFFPSGKYLTGTLSINTETSILGADRYNTSLVLKGGGNTPLLQGAINQSVRNISLDGNRLNQIKGNYLIDGNIDMALFDNVILCDSAHCITADTCNNSEFCNVLCKDIGDGVFITAAGNNNLLSNINTRYDINLTGNNNNWQSQQQTKIDSAEPLVYQQPQKLDDFFNFVTMQYNGNDYNVLVEGNELSKLPEIAKRQDNILRMDRVARYNYTNPGRYTDLDNVYTPCYSQGFTIVNGNYLILLGDLNHRTQGMTLVEYNGTTKIRELTNVIFGHGSGLSYNEELNELYVVQHQNLANNSLTNTIVVVDYASFKIKKSYNLNSNLRVGLNTFYYYDGFYWAFGNNVIGKYTINNDIVTLVEENLISEEPGSTEQTGAVYNGFLYILYYSPNMVRVVDLETYQVVNSFAIENMANNAFPVDETEGICFYNGDCYISTAGRFQVYNFYWYTQIFKTNFNKTMFIPDYSRRMNERQNVYVDAEANNLNPTGTSTNKFTTVEEAVSYITNAYNYPANMDIAGIHPALVIRGEKTILVTLADGAAVDVVHIEKSDVVLATRMLFSHNFPTINSSVNREISSSRVSIRNFAIHKDAPDNFRIVNSVVSFNYDNTLPNAKNILEYPGVIIEFDNCVVNCVQNVSAVRCNKTNLPVMIIKPQYINAAGNCAIQPSWQNEEIKSYQQVILRSEYAEGHSPTPTDCQLTHIIGQGTDKYTVRTIHLKRNPANAPNYAVTMEGRSITVANPMTGSSYDNFVFGFTGLFIIFS